MKKKQRKLYTNILYEHQCKTGQHNTPPQQNEVKKKTHMVISIYAERIMTKFKAFQDKNSQQNKN